MQETPETLLEETSELLNALAPVVQRGIDALQHDPNPLLQHLIQQEIECQEGLLQRIAEIKEKLNSYLNPPENVTQLKDVLQQDEQEGDLQQEDSELDEEIESQETGSEEIDLPEVEPEQDDPEETGLQEAKPEEDIQPEQTPPRRERPRLRVLELKEIGNRLNPPPVGPLAVTMPNREKICRRFGSDTFVEVIEKIGIEKVKSLNLRYGENLLINDVNHDEVKLRKSGRYYIKIPSAPYRQAPVLEKIAKGLKIMLEVELL